MNVMTDPKVSVAILTSNEIYFELHGDFSFSTSTNRLSGRFKAFLSNNKLIVKGEKEEFTFENDAVLIPEDQNIDSFLIRDVVIGIKFHWEKKENQRFQGSLKLLKDGNNLIAINVTPIEHYLTSVISSEMSAYSSPELLKAHAIISRSWLIAQIEKSNEIKTRESSYETTHQTDDELIKWYDREDHTLFDVCADDHCQRYQGITKAFTEKVKEGVEQTSGLVLTFNNKICDARFSKCCGGISEAFENVWEPVKHPYLTKVVDYKFDPDNFELDLTKENAAEKWIRTSPTAFCNTTDESVLSQVLLDYDQSTKDFYRWEIELTQDEISSLIKEKSGIDFGNILDLIPIERGVSGRLIKLKIVGTNKTLIIGKELEIRRILSKSHLYSSAFVVDKKDLINEVPQKFILTGAGWGHGVGLCQIGAAVMGEMGYRFDEILLHYFKDAKIKRLY